MVIQAQGFCLGPFGVRGPSEDQDVVHFHRQGLGIRAQTDVERMSSATADSAAESERSPKKGSPSPKWRGAAPLPESIGGYAELRSR